MIELDPIQLPQVTTAHPTWRLSIDVNVFESNSEREDIDAVF